MTNEISHREPLIRISKREPLIFWKAWLIRLTAVVLALIICSIIIYVLVHSNPLDVYNSMIDGAFGTVRRTWTTIRDATILLCVALALAPAFKMRFWNIGAEGQVLIGALVTAAVMRYCGNTLPTWLLFVAIIIASVLAGLIWGIVPALFKAKWNTNETLFTLMMNYIAIQLVACFSILWEDVKGSGTVGTINQSTKAGWLPTDFLGDIFGTFNYAINALIVLVVTVLVFVYMRYSKQGYELAVVGESENTARYAGINVKKVIMRTMAISGAICGLAGFILVSGSSHTISVETAGGRGFTAIIVAWLAKFNAFVMVLISFFLVFMEKGAKEIATQFGLNESASEVLTGIILFFILGCEFFINYKLKFRASSKGEM